MVKETEEDGATPVSEIDEEAGKIIIVLWILSHNIIMQEVKGVHKVT